jgi:hypothetical protein
MPNAEYLHRQAENCLRIARSCFDLASAERMRHLATELKAKAAELENRDTLKAPITGRESSCSGENNRE